MTLWRYKAVSLETGGSGRRSGEIAAETAAEARASLRRIGLQVIELRRLRRERRARRGTMAVVLDRWHQSRRRRRLAQRSELYDGMATMLASGIPLLESVATLADAQHGRRSSERSMLLEVRERLRSGATLGEAMTDHPDWFDRTEVAMVEAGQTSGELTNVLRSLADGHERAGELAQRFVSALTYPAVVAAVGLAVTLFLGAKVLPDLAGILVDARIEVPPLTARVMGIGQWLVGHWLLVLLILAVLITLVALAPSLAAARGIRLPTALRSLNPAVRRRMAVAEVSLRLAELVRTGVPLVDALRVVAPTVRSLELRACLDAAADRAERGEDLAAALDDPLWFDAEYRRLLDVGQSTGELAALLERIGHRYARRSRRLVDRLSALLEPTVILLLAGLIGIVVMSAILPLIRLQEII